MFAALPSGADTLSLKNGDRLTGTAVTMVAGVLTFDTDYAGPLTVDWEEVEALALDKPTRVVLDDGREWRLRRLPAEGIQIEEVTALAPPPPAPAPPVRWEGRADFGYAEATGNRDAKLGTLTVLAQRRHPGRWALSLLFDAARADSEGEETANRARVEGKFDRNTGDHNYRYLLLGAGYDRVRDIDLRTELGVGIGRTLADTDRHFLAAEVGVSYVRDALSTDEMQDDAKLRLGESWRCHLARRTSLQQSLALLSALDEVQDYTAEFVLALTHQMNNRLALTSKIVNSYDSRPALGTERSDLTFSTQLGMTFGGVPVNP